MSWLKFVFALCVLAVSIRNVRTASADDRQKIKAAVLPQVVECNADFGVSVDEIKTAQELVSLGSIDPCFMGCVLKKTQLIDDQGLFDVDRAEEFTMKYFSDEVYQKRALDIISTCKAVNERNVTDGEKGYERAGLLIECFKLFKDLLVN